MNAHRAAKHRAPGLPVENDWTRWPRHRSDVQGPAPADGMEEYQRKWVAAMQVRAVETQRRLAAVCN